MNTGKNKNTLIKSFVKRHGRFTEAQKNAIETLWDNYGIDYSPDESADCLIHTQGFRQLKLEIGIGNGDALIHMAASDPQSLYIGVEVHLPGIGQCLNNIKQRELDNVRLISHDAIEVLQQMIGSQSLDRVLLFFADPWPKRRHFKRRIVNQTFRDLLFDKLKQGASIHMATDWQDYADYMVKDFFGDDRFINEGDAQGFCQRPDYRPQTKFESRGLKLGHGVWDMVFTKRGSD